MEVSSFEFLCLLLAASTVFPFLPGVRARQTFLTACNLAFLYLWLPNVASWILLAAFLGTGYMAGIILRARPSGAGFAGYLLFLLTGFVVLKKYQFLGFLVPNWVIGHPIAIIGLSYMLFRQIHFVVDAMQAQVDRPSLWNYLNYQANLFSLLAGPIQRYQDFRKGWDQMQPTWQDGHELVKTYGRFFIGILKVAGVATVLNSFYMSTRARLLATPAGADSELAIVLFVAIFYLYPLYVYANFSGYCDIVIAGAALFGNKLPENFDRPYLSRNILDFWTRWHQTLGLWIRDYLFMPAYKAIAQRSPARAPSLAFACYFLAFVLAGLWHGTTSNFLVFGLLHGAGASTAKLWEMCLVKWRGRPFLKRYLQSRPTRVLAIGATLHYAAFTMLFFPGSLGECLRPIKALIAAVWPIGLA